jgi:hypothetical protein
MNYDLERKLNKLIIEGNDEDILELLESTYQKDGLTPSDMILYGVTLMMPPFGDYSSSESVFLKALNSGARRDAAIWFAYLYTTLYPNDSSFVEALKEFCHCEISTYMIGLYSDSEGDREGALQWVRQSCSIKTFPKNLIYIITYDFKLERSEKTALFSRLNEQIQTKNFENEPLPKNKSELYDSYWDELILGKKMTSHVWEMTFNRIQSFLST